MGMRRSRVQLRRSSSSEGSGCRNPYVLDKKDEEEDSSDELDLGQPPSSSSTRSRGSTSSVDLMTLSALAIQESSGSPLSFNRTHTLRSSISSTTSQMIRTPTFTAYGGTSNAFRDLVISTSPDILSQPFSTSRRSHSKTPEGDDGDTEMQGRWKDAIIISDESDEDGPILIETGEEDINMRDGEGADTAIPKRINKQKATRRAGKRIISTRSTSTTFKSSTTGSVSSKTRQVDEAGKKSRKDTSLRRSRRLRSKDEEGAK
ncbi:hypothetical protein I302_101290 [Kwoniella bestiolae CBS 10118]|uniref:Uncharacterized protein n=1 Tax=Kwoniella bestiolae CBS 10118 TaxID=1296100 RepID=A0A1B9G7I6_9TREE|nr:hypothetical protein I302_04664 [Kwoniella bestiolae CBS 10118]OCF26972.1 hypothetical protein I302_04664 [Kwoniella bestiolae CBS 10118]